MENVFYGVVSGTGKFVLNIDRGMSSSNRTIIMLDVAPSSATFLNQKELAQELKDMCEDRFPYDSFEIRELKY